MKTGVGERFDGEEGKGEVAAGRTRVHLAGGGVSVHVHVCVHVCTCGHEAAGWGAQGERPAHPHTGEKQEPGSLPRTSSQGHFLST